LKFFTKGREVYEEYYGFMLRGSAIFDLRHKPIMWDKMDTFLRVRDSARTADWWKRYWRQAWTLADCGYGNCTHQKHQEGRWRPVKRGTGCKANGDESQALGTFTSNLIGYARTASEDYEQHLRGVRHGTGSSPQGPPVLSTAALRHNSQSHVGR
jgi:hypothetical protein